MTWMCCAAAGAEPANMEATVDSVEVLDKPPQGLVGGFEPTILIRQPEKPEAQPEAQPENKADVKEDSSTEAPKSENKADGLVDSDHSEPKPEETGKVASKGPQEMAALEQKVNPEPPASQEAPAPKSVEQASSPDTPLSLGFSAGTFTISRKPVGIEFDTSACPVQISKVGGHGADLGIQVGWVVETLCGVPVDNDFQVFYQSFVERLNALPGDPQVGLLFERPDGTKKTVVVPRSPLGMSLTKTLPTKVATSNDQSLDLGILPGWTLLKFGNKAVADYSDWDSFFEAFKTSMARLPQK